MGDQQTRLTSALNRLASATGVLRARSYDRARAQRNGTTAREEQYERVIAHLESAITDMWDVIDADGSKKAA
jgi:hypothetical protein